MRNLLLIIVAAVLGAIVAGCNSDEPYSYGDFRFDMVTYAGSDDGRAVFELLQRDDSRIMLRTTARCSVGVDVGQRMMLNYIPAGEIADGKQDIVARGYTEAVTDSLRYTADIDSVVMDSVRLKSVWRTGNYLNITSELKYTEGARQFYLVMDKASWHADTVRTYLVHNMMDEQAYFWRKCYASFYIGAVWKLKTCKVLRVYMNDVMYPDVKYYDFAK